MRNIKTLFKDLEFNKKFFSLVVPIAFSQLMLSVVSAFDAIMLNLISQDKMSAVSLATQITFVHNLFLMSITGGMSLLMAQYFGKNDLVSVKKIFGYALKLSSAVSILFSLFSFFAPQFLMRILTNDQTLITGGAQYLKIVAPAYLLTGISQVFLATLKNTGKAKTASIISAACMAGDVIMNLVLIVGLFGFPRLEIVGAALSTTIARAAELLCCIFVIQKPILRCPKFLAKDFWKYTLPLLCNYLVWGVGLSMVSVIMGHLGKDAVAAASFASIVKNLICCLCLGIGGGGAILVGNVLGAGEFEKAKSYADRVLMYALFSGILSFALLTAASPYIAHACNLSKNASELLVKMLVICAVCMIGKAVNSTLVGGIFLAGGDSQFGFWCDLITVWGICIPLGVIFAFVFKIPTVFVYIIISLDEIIKIPAVIKHYKKYNWVKNITKEN